MQNLSSTSRTNSQTPQPPTHICSLSYETIQLHCFSAQMQHEASNIWPYVASISTQDQQWPPAALESRDALNGPRINVHMKTVRIVSPENPRTVFSMAVTGDGTETGSTGDLTNYQLHNLHQDEAGVTAHSSQKPLVDSLQKREVRLMKNREAARECRRKKKEYVKCLENRVAVLENLNKTLIEEIRNLKDIYQQNVE